jgi:hypothetical protein
LRKQYKEVTVVDQPFGDIPITAHDVTIEVWNVDEADRFAKLAFKFPELLDHNQECLWKLISENGYLWRGMYAPLEVDRFQARCYQAF